MFLASYVEYRNGILNLEINPECESRNSRETWSLSFPKRFTFYRNNFNLIMGGKARK